jgi:hypothetical protein
MRFRLLRRRLTISAPRMAVRSALPWPLRWLAGAVVLGFSAALALWAFEFGKDIAGLDQGSREQLQSLRAEHQRLTAELAALKSVAHTADSLLVAERATQEQLKEQLKQLEADNRQLRGDLAFFEQLIPAGDDAGVAVRGLRAQRQPDGQLEWQLLLMQAQRNPPEVKGELELTVAGSLAGRPWSANVPVQAVVLRQHLRLEGRLDVPPQAVLKTISVRLLQAGVVKATHTQRL